MRFNIALGLAALAATANAGITARQATSADSGSQATPRTTPTASTPSSTSVPTSTATPTTTSDSGSGGDTTVYTTTTVTRGAKSTSTTTVAGSTRVSTLTDTSTAFVTVTVTSSDNDVATRTPDTDMIAGASEVPVGGARPMSHDSSTAFRQPPVRTALKPAAEGYRGTAMGDGRAGYAKPDYGSSYGPSRSTTTTVPPTRTSGGADALPEHPSPGSEHVMAAVPHMGSPTVSNVSPPPSNQASVPPPQSYAHELGTDNSVANKWHNESAAEIDSQPIMGHQSGPVYEMPTENYR
ncbi:hypothetical protein BM221_006341 [Beauveria bassiana]|uniref:Uncharacterized protein n=1 Tax=Beauveria bassiana TaxID=176275 RepID=A0A2N6NLN5_BEABA|nr:hypothetical protein BM221_006341 [Beauveria bassiana]